MRSRIAQAIQLKYSPIAVVLTDHKPTEASQFIEGRWGCVAAMLNAAAKGRQAVFDRKTFGCLGGGVGLGFGDMYKNFPGGIDHFLSTGNEEFCQTDFGKAVSQQMPHIKDGEGYIKTPELARKFIDDLPLTDIPNDFVVFKPLSALEDDEEPATVVFLVNPDQLSALIVLANYGRESGDNVIAPFGAGCHQVGIFPYREGKSSQSKAVIGLTDISVRAKFDSDILSFAVPFAMFQEMEGNVDGSFLQKNEWQAVLQRHL